jgi:hypothetical protein
MKRRDGMIVRSSTQLYQYTKDWGRASESHAFSSGEADRLEFKIPERRLDDRSDLMTTHTET